ncbi:hypothetical protein R5R35_007730 [Gryllus longicercus]|uniref:Guanine nucleotide-binding protein subunit beta-like protein 1 n=1 Tax=Gryllus longicercus TaxID=2509291 RepID=A0AAN9VJ85_9ORTH
MDNNSSSVNPVYFFNEEESGHCLAFVQDEIGASLLCGREDGTVSVWDLTTLRMKESAVLCAGSMPCISVNICGRNLITQDKTGLIKFWEKSETWKERRSLQLDYCGFCKITVNSEQNLIACPHKSCILQVYNMEFEEISILKPDETKNKFGYVMNCKFVKSNEKCFLLVSYENGSLILWDLETKIPLSELNVSKCPVFALDFDDGKNQGVCGSNTRKLSVFKLHESSSLENISTIKIKTAGVGSVRILPSQEILVVGCWDSMIRIFSWKYLKLLTVMSFHSQSIEDLCFSSKNSEVLDCECVLFATSRDKKISIWNVSDFCALA